jgi:hypothetical protein
MCIFIKVTFEKQVKIKKSGTNVVSTNKKNEKYNYYTPTSSVTN